MRLHGAIFILFTLCLFSSCRRENRRPYYHDDIQRFSPHVNNYPDTNRFAIPYTDPVVNGYTKFYYQDSYQLISEGDYINGRPSGYWKLYYPNGFYMREGNYSNGQLTGYWKFYYPDGKMQEEGNYQNNLRSGTWKYYYPSGNIASEGNFSSGRKQGEWRTYEDIPGALPRTSMF